jgi:hypothetical protein
LAFVAALYERRAYLGGCHDSAVTDRRYRTFETASSERFLPGMAGLGMTKNSVAKTHARPAAISNL